MKTRDCTVYVEFSNVYSFLTHKHIPYLTKCLTFADNEGDAVLLHVPASSERQEIGNNVGPKNMKIN